VAGLLFGGLCENFLFWKRKVEINLQSMAFLDPNSEVSGKAQLSRIDKAPVLYRPFKGGIVLGLESAPCPEVGPVGRIDTRWDWKVFYGRGESFHYLALIGVSGAFMRSWISFKSSSVMSSPNLSLKSWAIFVTACFMSIPEIM